MDQPLISIIIPVYNVGDFLNACVGSIVDQWHSDPKLVGKIEVLLIDDGSTDESGLKCDGWASSYEWIQSHHKDNGGVSSARNYGLGLARGAFIQFVDSDDVLAENCLATLLGVLEGGDVDTALLPFSFLAEDGSGFESAAKCSRYGDFGRLTRDEALDAMFGDRIFCYAWSCVARKSIYDAGVRFPEGMLLEDMATFYKVMLSSSVIQVIPDPVYLYRVRKGSICGTRNALLYESGLRFCDLTLQDFHGTEFDIAARRWCLLYLCKWECSLLSGIADVGKDKLRSLSALYERRIRELAEGLADAGIGNAAKERIMLLRFFKIIPKPLLKQVYVLRDSRR